MYELHSKSMMENVYGDNGGLEGESTGLEDESSIIDINTAGDLSQGSRVEDVNKQIQKYQRRRLALQTQKKEIHSEKLSELHSIINAGQPVPDFISIAEHARNR